MSVKVGHYVSHSENECGAQRNAITKGKLKVPVIPAQRGKTNTAPNRFKNRTSKMNPLRNRFIDPALLQ